jgi:phage tail tape-measure protein
MVGLKWGIMLGAPGGPVGMFVFGLVCGIAGAWWGGVIGEEIGQSIHGRAYYKYDDPEGASLLRYPDRLK